MDIFFNLSRIKHYYVNYCRQVGPGSSDYGLDGPGIESRWAEIFRRPDRPWGPTQPPVQWVPGLSRG